MAKLRARPEQQTDAAIEELTTLAHGNRGLTVRRTGPDQVTLTVGDVAWPAQVLVRNAVSVRDVQTQIATGRASRCSSWRTSCRTRRRTCSSNTTARCGPTVGAGSTGGASCSSTTPGRPERSCSPARARATRRSRWRLATRRAQLGRPDPRSGRDQLRGRAAPRARRPALDPIDGAGRGDVPRRDRRGDAAPARRRAGRARRAARTTGPLLGARRGVATHPRDTRGRPPDRSRGAPAARRGRRRTPWTVPVGAWPGTRRRRPGVRRCSPAAADPGSGSRPRPTPGAPSGRSPPAPWDDCRAVVAVPPTALVTARRVWPTPPQGPLPFLPTAHPLFLALDLAQDPARGREVLDQWHPDQPGITRVW